MEAFVNGIVSALSVDDALKSQLRDQEQQILDLLNREEELQFKCDRLVNEKIHTVQRLEYAERKLSDAKTRIKEMEECEADAMDYSRELEAMIAENCLTLKRVNSSVIYHRDLLRLKELELEAGQKREAVLRAKCEDLERSFQKNDQIKRDELDLLQKVARENSEATEKVSEIFEIFAELNRFTESLRLPQLQKREVEEESDEVAQYKARIREVGKKLYATETKLNLVTDQLKLVEKENSELKKKSGYLAEFAMTDSLVGFSTFF